MDDLGVPLFQETTVCRQFLESPAKTTSSGWNGIITTSAEFAWMDLTTPQKKELIVVRMDNSLFSLFNRFCLKVYLDTEEWIQPPKSQSWRWSQPICRRNSLVRFGCRVNKTHRIVGKWRAWTRLNQKYALDYSNPRTNRKVNFH